MYGPKWPFLLMYGSHDMRHTGFPRVDGLSTDPRNLGRHNARRAPTRCAVHSTWPSSRAAWVLGHDTIFVL